MEWFTEIDLYCERIYPGFWAEPLNAITNIAFIIASFWAWQTAYKLGKLDSTIKLLCIYEFRKIDLASRMSESRLVHNLGIFLIWRWCYRQMA